jgi:hypothetical protein
VHTASPFKFELIINLKAAKALRCIPGLDCESEDRQQDHNRNQAAPEEIRPHNALVFEVIGGGWRVAKFPDAILTSMKGHAVWLHLAVLAARHPVRSTANDA